MFGVQSKYYLIWRNFYSCKNDEFKKKFNKKVAVSLCMHPWASLEYDPNLNVITKLVGRTRKMGFEIVTYKELLELFL